MSATTLDYAGPRQAGTCPICRTREVAPNKTLFGHAVCKKCLYAFANRRQLAYIIDAILLAIVAVGVSTGLATLLVASVPQIATNTAAWIAIDLVLSLGINFLFTIRDAANGQSPGKRLMGVQVVDAVTGQPIGWKQSFRRNWFFLLGVIPVVGGLVAFALIITIIVQMNKGPRLGDRSAGTRVIWKKHIASPVFSDSSSLCPSCGYDLTGNVSGTCPECGAPVPPRLAPPTMAMPVG